MENQDLNQGPSFNAVTPQVEAPSSFLKFLIPALLITAIGCGTALYIVYGRSAQLIPTDSIVLKNDNQGNVDVVSNFLIDQKLPILVKAQADTIVEIDVNGDGKRDLIKYAATPGSCGSEGCRIYINNRAVIENANPPIYMVFSDDDGKLSEIFTTHAMPVVCMGSYCTSTGLRSYAYDVIGNASLVSEDAPLQRHAQLIFTDKLADISAKPPLNGAENWMKIYGNTELGFSFSYPPAWKVENGKSYMEGDSKIYPIAIYDTEKNYMSEGTAEEVVYIRARPDIFNGSIDKYLEFSFKAGYQKDFLKGETIIGGKKAYILQGDSALNPIHGHRDMRVLFTDSKIFEFFNNSGSLLITDTKIDDGFDQIIQTFKFTP